MAIIRRRHAVLEACAAALARMRLPYQMRAGKMTDPGWPERLRVLPDTEPASRGDTHTVSLASSRAISLRSSSAHNTLLASSTSCSSTAGSSGTV